MEIVNSTGMPAGYTLGLDPQGREHVVVVVKGTFRMPAEGEEAVLADTQVPLVMADEFTGEPAMSATVYESDFPLVKPRCDVVLHGTACAPGGTYVTEMVVGLAVGTMVKQFRVVGNRVWENRLLSVRPSDPEPFTRMPIGYDVAYGGTDVSPRDPERRDTLSENPAGIGYYPLSKPTEVVGRPLPNTEEANRPVKSWKGKYRPMSFGPIGRNVPRRVKLAGTYDQAWLDDVAPFLPKDFDPLYHQCAPSDQQIGHPKGGELVEMLNLTPSGRLRFTLPKVDLPVEFTNADSERTEKQAALDTIVLEPDRERFLLVWRASIPLKNNVFELLEAVVGRMPEGWYRARETGKAWYPSLADVGTKGGG